MSTAEIIAEFPRFTTEELAKVQARVKELVESTPATGQVVPVTGHPALGIWKDRTDLPDDPTEASKVLRERMVRRTDTAES